MNRVYKIIAYLTVSLLLSCLIFWGDNSFFNSFLQNIIPLLATLFAINVTANSLVTSELNKLKIAHPEANIRNPLKEIKKVFLAQIVIILALFFILILRDFLSGINFPCKNIVTIVTNACVIGSFFYFLEIIADIGKALFMIIDFNSKDDKDSN